MTDSPATAKIAVAAATYWVDRPFDYRIPPVLADKVVPGVRVVVPFGGGNRRTEGIVLSLGTAQSGMRLKSIASVLDAAPVLSPEMIRLAVWLRERYFCTVYDAVHAMLPAGLWYQMESVYTICAGFDRESAHAAAGKSAQEQLVLDAVFAHGGSCPLVDLERLFENVSPARA
ncbi:MAG: primosomal protein N', partial [Clostridiales bacterium]|nr:primosomal protein N' [Clostridiales bacterium]